MTNLSPHGGFRMVVEQSRLSFREQKHIQSVQQGGELMENEEQEGGLAFPALFIGRVW